MAPSAETRANGSRVHSFDSDHMLQKSRERTVSDGTGSTLMTSGDEWGRSRTKESDVPFSMPGADPADASQTKARSRLSTAGSVGSHGRSRADSFGGGRDRFDTAATLRRLSFDVPGTPDSFWARSRAGSKDVDDFTGYAGLGNGANQQQQGQLAASQIMGGLNMGLAQYLQQALPKFAENSQAPDGAPLPGPEQGVMPPYGNPWLNVYGAPGMPYGVPQFNNGYPGGFGMLPEGLPLSPVGGQDQGGFSQCFEGGEPSRIDIGSLLGQQQNQSPTERHTTAVSSGHSSGKGSKAHPHKGGAQSSGSSIGNATTLMLRNIPVKYDREMILQDIDGRGFAGLYDFFYLPIDFQTGNTVGYAFINLVTNDVAVKFEAVYNWLQLSPESAKICHVGSAKVQGKGKNIEQYRNSSVMSMEEKYHPLSFENGVRMLFPPPTRSLKPVKPRMKQ